VKETGSINSQADGSVCITSIAGVLRLTNFPFRVTECSPGEDDVRVIVVKGYVLFVPMSSDRIATKDYRVDLIPGPTFRDGN